MRAITVGTSDEVALVVVKGWRATFTADCWFICGEGLTGVSVMAKKETMLTLKEPLRGADGIKYLDGDR
jgi:hypothetical protein